MENRNKIELWLFDKDLVDIADRNDLRALEQMEQLYPEQREVIGDAFLLLQHIKIKECAVSELQVERSLKKFWNKIERKKKRKRVYWASAAAACVGIILAISSLLMVGQDAVIDQQEALAMLDSIEHTCNEILIVSGNRKAFVPNNQVISQTAQGDIVVGTEKKMKLSDMQDAMIQLVVPMGKRTSIRFIDGTVAWLNSGTKPLYPKDFSKSRRDIYIEGESYLEVERDQSRPFYVHTKEFDVSVLGTTFNVNAYKGDHEKSVVLVEGSVEVTSGSNNKYKLLPKEGFFSSKKSVVIKKVDTYAYTCWKDGIMQIQNETLEHIFTRLERCYGVNINCDSVVSGKKYIGHLNLYATITEVLHNLSLSTSFTFDYNRETNNVKIHQKTNRYSK